MYLYIYIDHWYSHWNMGRTAFLVLKMPIYNHVLRPCDCVEPNKPPTHWRGKKYSRHPLTSFNINKMAENESQPSSSGENIPCRNSFSENSPTDHIHQALIVSYIVIILPPICSHACLCIAIFAPGHQSLRVESCHGEHLCRKYTAFSIRIL